MFVPAVAHPVKCGACKASPVVGLRWVPPTPRPQGRNPLVSLCRYQCLQCLGYDLCQSCFLHGMISKNHSIKHRMQEHCQQVGDATGRHASVAEEVLESSDVPSICLDCTISPLAEHAAAVVRRTRVESQSLLHFSGGEGSERGDVSLRRPCVFWFPTALGMNSRKISH